MNLANQITIILSISIKICQSIEILEETAWMDDKTKDKYFEYTDVLTPLLKSHKLKSNFSNNVDFEQFQEEATIPEIKNKIRKHVSHRNQGTHASLSVIDFLVNSIKKAVIPQDQSSETHRNRNETSKGIDIKFDSNINALPSFGNNGDMQFIFVGTKWCGSGDVARDENDIGYFYLTDNCCRVHDQCPEIIEAQESKFGLKNSGKFTRLHCDCDEKFYKCLKRVNTLVSKQVGIFYFNVLGHQCFKEDHPIVGCKVAVKGRCVNWINDNSKSKEYQWIDNKWF